MVKKAKVPSPKKNLKIQKQEAVRLAIEQIEKQYGKGSIMKLGDRQSVKVDIIPTGSIALDLAGTKLSSTNEKTLIWYFSIKNAIFLKRAGVVEE